MPPTCLLRRPQYSVIGRDVKQAVRLLEMSLSGLMSAETALNIWRDEIPSKVRKEHTPVLTSLVDAEVFSLVV